MPKFKIISDFKPRGDQPKAIAELAEGLKAGEKELTLLGVTGSGKTYTMANIIEAVQRPTLVISHNKTLAAQLCQEFRTFFFNNAVEYFVSYYDYYQPEAYIPQTDTYIEKETSINEEIDRLRHSATMALFERKDVIIVASVSAIYNLGRPTLYFEAMLPIEIGKKKDSEEILRALVSIYYERNDYELKYGRFRVRGDTIEIMPSYGPNIFRIELFEDKVEKIYEIHPVSQEIVAKKETVHIYPASHYVTWKPGIETAIKSIEQELWERLKELRAENKLLEAQRLETRTKYDLELISEMGFCPGIENYSRHFDGRKTGEPPWTLLDYFPEDFLMFIDESHVTIPQVRGMYEGDRSRKEVLVEYGFRLPSAIDNRPLNFDEFNKHINQIVYVSATPATYELKRSSRVVEQIIRPTGLVDPEVLIRGTKGQINDLMSEIKKRTEKKERVLVTTLTKRMAEDLADYLLEAGINSRYLHSDIETLDRIDILRGLRLGEFDVLVGINLLREGLDLPEVSLVAILDADKEGFLRSETSIIQTIGRAARNVGGQVILYADQMTDSMKRALEETNRRRKLQLEFNKKHHITPQTIVKEVKDIRDNIRAAEVKQLPKLKEFIPKEELPIIIKGLEEEMRTAAMELEFEKAARIRDRLIELKKVLKREE